MPGGKGEKICSGKKEARRIFMKKGAGFGFGFFVEKREENLAKKRRKWRSNIFGGGPV